MKSDKPVIAMKQTVKDVLERHPATRKVFARYGLDLCCGGVHDIATSALAAGLKPEDLLAELNAAAKEGPGGRP